MSFVCLEKLCLLSQQYTEVLTSPCQSLTKITYFLAVGLTCCHTAASLPNPGEEVGSFDWLIHHWFWWTKDSFGGKSWSWAAEQLLKMCIQLHQQPLKWIKAIGWTEAHELERWNPSPDTGVGKQRNRFLVQLSNSIQWSGESQWDISSSPAGSALPQELTLSRAQWEFLVTWTWAFPSSSAFPFVEQFLLCCYNTDVECFFCPLPSDFLSQKMQRTYVAEMTMNARLSRGSCYFQDVSLRTCKNVSEDFVWAAVLTHLLYFLWWLPEARFLFFLADSRCICARS